MEKKSRILLEEHGAVFFDGKDNTNTFCRFFSNLADSLVQNLPRPEDKFGIKTTGEYFKHFLLHNVDVTAVD